MNYLEIFSIMFFLGALGLVGLVYFKRVKLEKDASLSMKENELLKVKTEIERKAEIMVRLEEFLKHAQYINLVGALGEQKIYDYIFNSGYLYQFDEIMADNNIKIGVDDNLLCFKKLLYKRVNNPTEFLEKFASQLMAPNNDVRIKIVM